MPALPTRVLQVDPSRPDPAAIRAAAAVIRAGGLVAFPTETVYGLGANALDAVAVARVFEAKGRPASDPLIVHIAELAQLGQAAVDWPPVVEALAARFWPGPLTLVLPRCPEAPANLSAGGPTVAVRMPNHPVAQALIEAAGVPIAAPSANLFARPSPTTAAHVLEDLWGRIDLVLDGGSTAIGVESTVIDLAQSPPRLLRPGGASLEALREALPALVFDPAWRLPDGAALPSPGLLAKHYSPRAEMILVSGAAGPALARMRRIAGERIAAGQKVGLLIHDEDASAFEGVNAHRFLLGSSSDLEETARRLFAGLRDLDQRGVDAIVARLIEADSGLGLAIQDRLLRAAEGKVIETGTE